MISRNLQAQDCSEKVFAANKLLEAGKTQETITMLYPCANIISQTSSQWQACRLITIAYLAQGQEDSARIYGETMLELNPFYKVNPLKDPKSLSTLLSKIVVMPKYSFGIALSAGSNRTIPQVTQGYIVANYSKKYRQKNSSQFGTNVGFYINPSLKLDIGLMATTKSYEIDYSFDRYQLNYSEKLTYLEIPLSAKYILRPNKRLRFFGSFGAFGGRILYSENSLVSNNIKTSEKFTLSNFSSMDRRKKFNYGICGGIGIYYKLKNGQLNIESSYYRNLNGITIPESRYTYSDMVYNYFFVDDDLILNNITLNVGYSFYLKYMVYNKKSRT